MKIASYSHDGTPTYGVVEGGGLIDMAPRLGARYPTLKAVLEAGALLEVEDAARRQSADHALDAVTLLPTIPDAGKILCIGLNYRSHVEEGGRDVPKQPMVFVRFPDSQVGSGEPLVRPKASEMFDFEGEMAVVIGTRARHVREVDSLTYIAGYACFNDGSVRDWQRHTSQFTPGKNFHRSGSFGPWNSAASRGVCPALFWRLQSAPARSRMCTHEMCPLMQATWSGVSQSLVTLSRLHLASTNSWTMSS